MAPWGGDTFQPPPSPTRLTPQKLPPGAGKGLSGLSGWERPLEALGLN